MKSLICCCVSIAFAASAAAANFSFLDWIELSPNDPPPARSYLAMTYDSVSGKIIAFGGLGTGYLNDTWSSTARAGRDRHTPPPVALRQMTADSVAQKIVLFGVTTEPLPGRYMALGWIDITGHVGDTPASPFGCYRPMLFPDPNGSADLWRIGRPIYQLTMWQWSGSDWTGYRHRLFRLLGLHAVANNTSTGQVVMFLAVSLMLTRITPDL
jgi:hypothetical protein